MATPRPPCADDGNVSSLYATLADTLLGACVRPFAHFVPPADIRPAWWYPHSNLERRRDLARRLAAHANGSYMIEIGSFIGNSAAVWSRSIDQANADAVVVCMDTWLGDVNMWTWKRQWLGHGSRHWVLHAEMCRGDVVAGQGTARLAFGSFDN